MHSPREGRPADTRQAPPRRSAPLAFASLRARPPLAFPGQRIGLFGGTFDPPHAGHLAISQCALKRLALDRVWWLVSPGNPLKSPQEHAGFASRLAEARRFVRDPRIRVTGFEAALPSPYSAATIAFLRQRLPGVRFVWLMGADNLAAFHRWRLWREIFRTLPIAVIDRPGWHLPALASPAARAFARARLPEAAAPRLATRSPPAWVYLTVRLSPLSSTLLRATRGGDRDACGP